MSRIYTEAAQVLEQFIAQQGGIKSLAYDEAITQKKAVFALVAETLKYRSVIEGLIEAAHVFGKTKPKESDRSIVMVMVYDLLFGRGSIEGGGHWKKLVLAQKSALTQHLVRLKISRGAKENADLLPPELRVQNKLPRYARVNTLKASLFDLQLLFASPALTTSAANTAQSEAKLKPSVKAPSAIPAPSLDPHIADLLVFPPGTDLHDHPAVLDGRLILQDKASCFPAFVLRPTPGSHVIDACAAPGNKTTHLAALMAGTGRVDAFEINAERHALLNRMVERAGAQSVIHTHHASFLDVQWPLLAELPAPQRGRQPLAAELKTPVHPYSDVEYILLDPTCSGSGMVQRIDSFFKQQQQQAPSAPLDSETIEQDSESVLPSPKQNQDYDARVAALGEFQLSMLHHALNCPTVKRVVYSTCSVHQQENEDVVAHALARHPEFALVDPLPSWTRRGLPVFDQASKCIRCDPAEDLTQGFFVALFERVKRRGPAFGGSADDALKGSTASSSKGVDDDDDEDDDDAPATGKQFLKKRQLKQLQRDSKRRQLIQAETAANGDQRVSSVATAIQPDDVPAAKPSVSLKAKPPTIPPASTVSASIQSPVAVSHSTSKRPRQVEPANFASGPVAVHAPAALRSKARRVSGQSTSERTFRVHLSALASISPLSMQGPPHLPNPTL